MRLFVQIPCLNEEATLPMVLAGIPKQIDGVDEIHILVVDDGSSDRTVEVARALGVEHFVFHTRNMGLARSFRDGVDYALQHGADIVVNTDGDNQYPQERIADLVQPILHGEADIVIGDRQTKTIAHFSPFKKLMQGIGSNVVNFAAETDLPDAASGFRAYSREALVRLNVVTQFSYCMETIIQAGNKRLRIASVAITTNPKTRESRLFKNIFQHMGRSAQAIMRSYIMFKPHAVFLTLGLIFLVGALIPFGRFLVLTWMGVAGDHIQSLILGSAMLVGALLSIALLVISDMLRTNRTLVEDALERIKLLQYAPDRQLDPKVGAAQDAARHPSLAVSAEAVEAVLSRHDAGGGGDTSEAPIAREHEVDESLTAAAGSQPDLRESASSH
ncbi:glycosyltransferase family 2 protein [Microbacterium sp. CFBP9034]|uniref:glycosyltransferase family 2 protein n=1 Tax=Microbacterium sp. CFBP9034 TaxID=3096540 RepID=UPI002A6A3995|nr:glycosyltransferase family 2 protein [Microbacterium sp. CFBP9034]MDY0909002.1 glycosyltransferase family 2 protein [Microbacterium sp. CFBP9034]